MVAQTLRKHVRSNDPLIRMGGDEFVLLLPGCSQSKACEIADQTLQSVAGSSVIENESVTTSIGMAFSMPKQDMPVKELIAQADQAMYVAKALGGNRCEVSDSDSGENSSK